MLRKNQKPTDIPARLPTRQNAQRAGAQAAGRHVLSGNLYNGCPTKAFGHDDFTFLGVFLTLRNNSDQIKLCEPLKGSVKCGSQN